MRDRSPGAERSGVLQTDASGHPATRGVERTSGRASRQKELPRKPLAAGASIRGRDRQLEQSIPPGEPAPHGEPFRLGIGRRCAPVGRALGHVPRNSAGTSVQAVIRLGPGLSEDGSSDVNVTT